MAQAGVVQTMTFTKWQRNSKAAGRGIRARAACAIFAVAGIPSAALTPGICFAQAEAPKHSVARFIVYDISGNKPYKLFTIPVPADATGPVKGISGESQPLLLESGKHQLGVTAQNDKGEESRSYACTVWVTIP
jgi:hypothetical protein